MKQRGPLALVFIVFFVLHQDFWLWERTEALFGLPVGFVYHIAYCIAVTLVLALLVGRFGLEDDASSDASGR